MSFNNAKVTRVEVRAEDHGRYAEIRIEHSAYLISPAAFSFSELPAEIRDALLTWIGKPS